jgi:glycosyltransferase involved in cell wall biosynthesis
MRKLNVMQIITKLELGGAQKIAISTAEKLNREKYNVFFVSGNEGILVEKIKEIPDIKVYLMKELKREINPFYDILCLIKLVKIIKENKIDIVHTHSSKAGILGRIAAKFANTPIIVHTIHGFPFHNYQNLVINRLFTMLERIAGKFTDALIAVSNSDIKKGIEKKIGKKDKFFLVRPGINIQDFNKNVDIKRKKMEIGVNLNSKIVGMIGCFKPQKSPLDFIKIAKIVSEKYKDVEFVLIGDGKLRKKIEKMIYFLNLQDKIHLLGWRYDVNELIHTFDIFVLTSLWEGLPLVYLEAMAAGKPIVASNVDSAEEVINEGENGYLFPVKDVEKAAEKILYLLNNPEICKNMGQTGKNKLTYEFDEDNMIKKLEEIYGELENKKIARSSSAI